MIDFRYHLVSLISVFLALAVGIILGAGPLQGAIGDQLTDQVEQLRQERNTLRDDLDTAQGRLEDDEAFIVASGPQLVDGTLDGRRVAVVELDDVAADVREAVTAQVTAAGASVVTDVRLTGSWTDEEDQAFRETVAGGLPDDLAGADAEAPARLAAALTVALTGADEADPTARSTQAAELEGVLVRADLIDAETEQTAPADAIVLLSSGSVPAASAEGATATEAPSADSYALDIQVQLARTAQDLTDAAVVVGPTVTDGDLVSRVRGDRDLAESVSTVSGVEHPAGQITVPLAVAARLVGQAGQFGTDAGATAVLPPVVVLPPAAGDDATTAPTGDQTADGAGEAAGDQPTAGQG